ncbi:hypothetical protein [Xylophilus sp.]|uniref:hypothetical protein n=1 Tax=Xylophilus sp. TaxID=2653893 RepID=UPI0013B97904|nr:hypothetical protein [Xylophilus sp.]KAF1042892.1 MAG: hypothetical protein GAK38_04173 [Xylophilus sp.]
MDPVAIINRNPDIIIRNSVDGLAQGYQGWSKKKMAEQAQRVANRPGWNAIKAIKNKDVYVTNNFLYSAFGKQFGALLVAKSLYPDRFADIDMDTYFSRWLKLQGVPGVPASKYIYKLGEPT